MMKRLIADIWHKECAFLFRCKPSRAFFMCVYPFIIMGVLWTIFWGESLTQIPLAVVDESQGYYSRELVRALQASQFLNVSLFPSKRSAQKALSGGRVFGVLAIDADYDKNLLKRTGAQISAWDNNEYLLVGGNLNKGISGVGAALNAKYQRNNLAGLGVPAVAWQSISAPVQISETALYNPSVNYMYFLGLGLLPAVLQLFICLSVCYSFLWEIKSFHIKHLQTDFAVHPYGASAAKMMFYILVYFAVMLCLLEILIFRFGLPVQGSFLRVCAGTLACIFLTASTALLIAGITNNLRLAMSVCACYAAPAFAYYGVSFPVDSMPFLARCWAELMPGTHLNRIFINEFLRGANAAGTWGEIGFMVLSGAVLFWLGTKGYARWTQNDKYWGPKL